MDGLQIIYVLMSMPAGDLIYDALNRLHTTTRRAELADQIRELMTDESAPEKVSVMSQYLDMLEMDVEAEERYEDEDWFDGEGMRGGGWRAGWGGGGGGRGVWGMWRDFGSDWEGRGGGVVG